MLCTDTLVTAHPALRPSSVRWSPWEGRPLQMPASEKVWLKGSMREGSGNGFLLRGVLSLNGRTCSVRCVALACQEHPIRVSGLQR